MTKAENQRPKTKDHFVWISFALLILFVYFFGLDMPLVGPDEPRYAQVAREMFERGDWITPTLGGFDWFEKPALLYWLEITSYNIFGVNEFAARFGSALFGLGTILSLWILGKSVPSESAEHELTKDKGQRTKDNFANWLALIAASSIGLISFSRGASFDIILTFPMTASLVAYFIFDQANRSEKTNGQKTRRYISLALFYFFVGIALIGKGLVGIVFPFAIVSFYHILKLEILPSKTFLISLSWGIILSLLVASVWYLPMYQANGWKFIDEFFIQHHFQRYASNKYLHPQPFWFFWVVLPLMTIPWLPFFFASIWNSVKSKIRNWKSETPPLTTFAFAWLLVPLVFFSISGSKLPGYILPVLPAALILTAQYVYKFVRRSNRRKIALQSFAFLTFVFVIISLQFFFNDLARGETVQHLVKTADSQGYKNEKILNLHTISHSVEFYGAGRLVRETDGKQKRFYGVGEIVEQMKKDGTNRALVLIPLSYLKYLTESDLVETKVLDDNGETAICAVKLN